jgi:hypothetical protein
MKFQLWQHPKGKGHSVCFSRKDKAQVKPEFHTLNIGQDRIVHENDHWQITIVRSE